MKHNILISAFSCLPDRGSEPGIGWNWAIQAAKTQNVYVLTRTKCKEKIEPKIPYELKDNLHFIYCDSSSNLRNISIYLEYIIWQISSYRMAKKIIKEIKFDYIIHLTFGNVFLPTFMHKLKIPFIWGPLGGGEKVNYEFYKDFKLKDRFPHIVKDLLIKTVKINPFVLSPTKKSKLIIARTEDTKSIFPKKYHNKIDIKLETCIDLSSVNVDTDKKQHINDNIINLVFSGRLIAFKNAVALIEAMKIVDEKNIILHIIGDGNQKSIIEKKIDDYGLNNNVILHGEMPREQTLEIVKNSDIFVFPSLRECGSWALMEAMLLEKPIICFNRNGMNIVTDESCAIRIDANSQEELIKYIASAITNLTNNKTLMKNMGINARKRIEENFAWKNIDKYIYKILNRLDSIQDK